MKESLMTFQYNNDNNQIIKLNLYIGERWNNIKTSDKNLISIFQKIDNGDNVIQIEEINIFSKLMIYIDKFSEKKDSNLDSNEVALLVKHLNDNIISSEELIDMKNFDDANFWSLENLKKIYPAEKYKIEQNGDITIVKDSDDNEVINIENNGDLFVSLHDSRGYKGQNFVYLKNKVTDNLRLVENEVKFDEYLYCDYLKNILIDNSMQNKEQILDVVKDITEENVINILQQFAQSYDTNLETFVKNLSNIDNELKQNILSHIEKCVIKAVNYQENLIMNNQQIVNDQCDYIGDIYYVEWNKNNVLIKSNTDSKIYQIDLNKILNSYDNIEKFLIIGQLQSLPAEVLVDLSIEISSINKDVNRFMATGVYRSKDDSISYDFSDIQTLVHEIGHAVDYTFYKKTVWYDYEYTNSNLNSAVNNKEFMEAYQQEINNYINSGHSTFDPEEPNKEELYNYATYDEREMFAECYTLLTTGNCSSKDCLLKYFPQTIMEAKNHLKIIRNLPINSDSNNQIRRKS